MAPRALALRARSGPIWALCLGVLGATPLAGCKVGPHYVKPTVVTPAAYKEAGDWKLALPRDEVPRGAWWTIFRDPELSKLESALDVSNQNLALAAAQYRIARAAVRVALAGYAPTITVSASATRSRASSNLQFGALSSSGTVAGGQTSATSSPFTTFNLPASLSWEADIWGRISRTVDSAEASAQASSSDLQSARLSAQSDLASDYLELRSLDQQKRILDAAVNDFEKVLDVTKNRYAAGVVARSDVLQAQSQVESTRAQALDLGVLRAQMEHAIAVLVGVPASAFSLPASSIVPPPPEIPQRLPSEVLEQRPDIAAAERRMAAANAQIGLAQAAYFPRLTLSASAGLESSSLANLFSLPSLFWSVGPSLVATIVDGGLRRAQTDQARAAYDAAVATFRQAALTAFQDVEDQLAALRILRQEAEVQARALDDAEQAVTITAHQYQAGTVAYADLLVAETSALNDERTSADILGRRMVATALLIKALGGGWAAPPPDVRPATR